MVKFEIVLIKMQGVNLSFFKSYIRYRQKKTKVKRHKIFESTTLRRQILTQYENIIKYSTQISKITFYHFYETFNWVKWSFSRMEVSELKPCSQQKRYDMGKKNVSLDSPFTKPQTDRLG